MAKSKYSKEIVESILKEKGFQYISGECKGLYNKITIKDENGYLYYTCIANIQRLTGEMSRFKIDNPYVIDNIKNMLKLKNTSTSFLRFENSNNTYFKCGNCGNEFKTSITKFENNITGFCFKCANKSTRGRLKIDEIDKLLYNIGGWVRDENYIDSGTQICCTNKDGYKANITIDNIKANKLPKIFHSKNPYVIYNINNYFKNVKLPYKIEKDEIYKGYREKLKILCKECNHEFIRDFRSIKEGLAVLCPFCSLKSKSYISWLTNNWLIENNITFTMEKKYDTCVDKMPLPFDYYLDDYNILIEVDGKQHYDRNKHFGSKGEGNYEIIVLHDQIKNDWAKENNVKLIRLPYWEFKDDTYKETLKREILD